MENKILTKCENCSHAHFLNDEHKCKVEIKREIYSCVFCGKEIKYKPSKAHLSRVCSWDCHDSMVWIKGRKKATQKTPKIV
jgi:hypothetical protein